MPDGIESRARPAWCARAELTKRRPFLYLAAACVVLGLLGWSAYYFHAASVERHATERLQEKVDAMRAVETQMSNLRREISALDSTATPLLTAINERNFWPALLEELNARLPKQDIWITELIPTSGGKPVGLSEAERAKITSAASPTPSPLPTAPNKSAGRTGDRWCPRARTLSLQSQAAGSGRRLISATWSDQSFLSSIQRTSRA